MGLVLVVRFKVFRLQEMVPERQTFNRQGLAFSAA